MKKLVIIDFDRTLVEISINWARMRQKLTDFCLSVGIDISFVYPVSVFKNIKKALVVFLKRTHNKKSANQFRQNLLNIIKQEELIAIKTAKPVKGAKNFLKMLNSQKIKFIILSNNHSQCINRVFKKLHFPKPTIIYGWDNVEHIKPQPGALKKILARLKLNPRHCLLVGDSNTDLALGKVLGIQTCILKLYYREKKINYVWDGVDQAIFVDNFNQLKQILLKNKHC